MINHPQRFTISEKRDIDSKVIIDLYKANKWSAAEKPEQLIHGLFNSHTLISIWDDEQLIGIGNAISDGYLVVYYPHLLVHPNYQRQGVGKLIVDKMQEKYSDFHMQMLTADGEAIEFYKKMGFSSAGKTQSMWIYQGEEH